LVKCNLFREFWGENLLKDVLIDLIKHYGSIALFFSLILEYLGIPLPGETMMSFLGFLSWKSSGFAVYLSLISAIAGTLIGSNFAWLIGNRFGENIVLKYGKYVRITKEKLDSTGKSFNKHTVGFLIFGRYIPGVRLVIPYLSGISKLKFKTFFIYNLIGSIIWCTSFIGLGFLLGDKWVIAEKLIKAYSLILILLAVFVFIVFKFFNKHKKTIFAIAFPMLIFIKLIEDLIKNELSVLDNTIYKYLRTLISHKMTDFMKFMTFLGSGQVLIFISVVCILVFWRNKKQSFYTKMISVNLLAASIINEVFKIAFHRERPDILRLVQVSGFSFPSGHSMISISFYGFIAYILYKNIKNPYKYLVVVLFSILIFFIGISRIYLGVHYASDVLSGFSAGLAWLAIFITLINRVFLLKTSE
jgi:membrane protein DedA with SNARE-associated domain